MFTLRLSITLVLGLPKGIFPVMRFCSSTVRSKPIHSNDSKTTNCMLNIFNNYWTLLILAYEKLFKLGRKSLKPHPCAELTNNITYTGFIYSKIVLWCHRECANNNLVLTVLLILWRHCCENKNASMYIIREYIL